MTQEQEQTTQTPAPVDAKTAVPNDEFKTVGGIKFYKEQLEAERKQREELANELEQIKTNKLKEQNNWKDLYEQEQKKASEYQNKLTTISTALVEDKMTSAIEKEALALGILPSALEDLDLLDKSMIEVETTSTGKVHFNNVKEFVESIRAKRPYWFGANQDPNINTKKPGEFNKTELSWDQILELEKTDKNEYTKRVQEFLRKK